MRSKIVFVILILMVAAFGVLLALRERSDHEVAARATSAEDAVVDTDAQPDGGAPSPARQDGAVPPAADGGAPPTSPSDAEPAGDTAPPAPRKLMDRPLRVVGLGWELLAPGLVANRGTAPGEESRFSKRGVDVRFSVADNQVGLERALASGGAESEGADVAVLPLSTFVAASERLRALAPEAFLIVGWSRGREAFLAAGSDGLSRLPATGEVAVAGDPATPEAFLAMFVLDLAGVPPSRVRWRAPGETEALAATFAAVERGSTSDDERSIVVTTSDATRLSPYVAVAPRGFLDTNGEALEAWGAAWLEGVTDLARDVPAAARRIAALEGAPEALALLERLGQLEAASLRDNAQAAGLSGRGAVTFDALFSNAYGLLREADVLSSPSPDRVPLRTDIIEALVRAGASIEEPGAGAGAPSQPAAGSNAPERGPETVLTWNVQGRRLDEAQLVGMIGFIGGVFEPLHLRVAIRGDSRRAANVVATAVERFGLEEDRLESTRRIAGRGLASIEVIAAP